MNAIEVGTRGYDFAEWNGVFYDPDLPADWRFLYYCNQFRAVLLPSRSTLIFIAGGLPELVDDSDDAFRFTVELPWPLSGLDSVVERLYALGPRLTGVVLVPAADAAPGDPRLETLSSRWPVCVDTIAGDAAETLARSIHAASVWRPEREPAPSPEQEGRLLVARLGASSAAATRSALEALACWKQGERRAGLFFDDLATAPALACDGRVMAELMGV